MTDKDIPLREQIKHLQQQISRFELSEQKMRGVQSRLDVQVDTFIRIHKYSLLGFKASGQEALAEVMAEGVVDIFQLELGAIYGLHPAAGHLEFIAGCNFPDPPQILQLNSSWANQEELWAFYKQKGLWESPIPEDSPWKPIGLAHAMFYPMFDNRYNLIAVVLGGITQAQELFYDFHPNEQISSFMVYCQQMSGIYNNMATLRQAQRAGQAKSEFMANLSHEMRTPMNAILGMTQIVKREKLTPEIKKALDQIEMSSSHLLGLINDVLDISKIEEGKLILHNEPFDLVYVLNSLFGGQKQAAINRKIDLRLHCLGLEHTCFIGDAMRLSQVIINLLSNAIKFTPEGGNVSLTAEHLSQNDEAVLVKFTVEDNGIGIAPEKQQSVFSPFEQADNSISRRFGGTGLGLAISQRIAEMMGGEIKLNSTVGLGSSFYFSIWLAKDKSAQPAKQDAGDKTYDFAGLTTLVVDDIEINREIIEAFFDGTNMKLDMADNGEKAVGMVSASPIGYYDVILMDVQMPVMDGYAATKAIRSLDRPDVKDIIIIAMTANVFKEDVEHAHKAGMNGHVGKPIEYDVLFSTIQSNLDKQHRQ